MSRYRTFAAALSLVVLLTNGCGAAHPVDLPLPIQSTTLGVGDEFELRIAGEDKLPTTFVVAPDGSVDLPFINRTQVQGLEPQQVAAKVRAELIEKEFYTKPSVS